MHDKSTQGIVLRIIRIYVFMDLLGELRSPVSTISAMTYFDICAAQPLALGKEFMTSGKMLRERAGRR